MIQFSKVDVLPGPILHHFTLNTLILFAIHLVGSIMHNKNPAPTVNFATRRVYPSPVEGVCV